MKFHWGYGVGFLYAAFVGFMLFMVYKSSSQEFSLVTKDYYKDEIQYQQRINKEKNSAALKEKLNVAFIQLESKARISFPKNMSQIEGEIVLYRPSDSNKDWKITIHPNAENFQDVSLASLQKGLWRLQVDWKSGGEAYFDEKPLVIP